MADVALGVLAIVVGTAFCFRGYVAMRLIIPLWGAFSGFVLGAGLVGSLGGEGFLSSLLGWLVGALIAVVFGALAYLYYEVSVFIAMSAIGFALGTAGMVALGVQWSWLIVLVGVVVGVVLALLAILGDLPMLLLAVLTATAGATAVVTGIMLLLDVVSVGDFESVATTASLDDDWWWYALYLGLVIAGIASQITAAASVRGSMRAAWTESGGRQIAGG